LYSFKRKKASSENLCPWNEVLHCELPEGTVTEIDS
jgi:hypothetical protein